MRRASASTHSASGHAGDRRRPGSRSQGGTGLGLAIVARIAEAHGGRAALTERAGWRTCFTLEMPR